MRIQKWLELWHAKQERMKHGLRETYIHRILGERMFHRHVWVIDKRSIAGGVSLGLFVAFTPTIPFQMLLCVIGATLLRVNVAVSLVACWVTNPLTALPIYLSARRLGQYLFEHSEIAEFTLDLFRFENRTGRFMEQSVYLWTGCLVFSAVSALLGNLASRASWNLGHWLKDKAIRQRCE